MNFYVKCQIAARNLYEAERSRSDPTWEELPMNNQSSRVATVMRYAQAYLEANEKRKTP